MGFRDLWRGPLQRKEAGDAALAQTQAEVQKTAEGQERAKEERIEKFAPTVAFLNEFLSGADKTDAWMSPDVVKGTEVLPGEVFLRKREADVMADSYEGEKAYVVAVPAEKVQAIQELFQQRKNMEWDWGSVFYAEPDAESDQYDENGTTEQSGIRQDLFDVLTRGSYAYTVKEEGGHDQEKRMWLDAVTGSELLNS